MVTKYMSLKLKFLQLRFAGDLLMELGAGLELATAAVPHLFLPLACVANVAKVRAIFYHLIHIKLKKIYLILFLSLQNVATVTSTSTRTPIYKAFAKGENIGDVTAKGECVANIADLVCYSQHSFPSPRLPTVDHGLKSTYF